MDRLAAAGEANDEIKLLLTPTPTRHPPLVRCPQEDAELLGQLAAAAEANDEVKFVFATPKQGQRLLDYYGIKEADLTVLFIDDQANRGAWGMFMAMWRGVKRWCFYVCEGLGETRRPASQCCSSTTRPTRVRRAGSFALGCGVVFVRGWGVSACGPAAPQCHQPQPPIAPPCATHPPSPTRAYNTPPLLPAPLRCAAKYMKKGAKASDVATFLKEFHDGALEKHVKTEEPPADNSGPVKVRCARWGCWAGLLGWSSGWASRAGAWAPEKHVKAEEAPADNWGPVKVHAACAGGVRWGIAAWGPARSLVGAFFVRMPRIARAARWEGLQFDGVEPRRNAVGMAGCWRRGRAGWARVQCGPAAAGAGLRQHHSVCVALPFSLPPTRTNTHPYTSPTSLPTPLHSAPPRPPPLLGHRWWWPPPSTSWCWAARRTCSLSSTPPGA